MKKLLTILLTMLLSVSLFGCGGSKNTIVGTWNVSNLGEDIDYYFEIKDKTIRVLIDGEETLSSDYEIEDDKIVFINGKSGELPYTLNDDGTLTIINNGMELVLVRSDNKPKNEDNQEQTNETSSNVENQGLGVLTVDVDPSYLKYQKITFNQEYIDQQWFANGEQVENDSIEGIEINGYYYENFEVPDENFEKYDKIIYNFPAEIDGLPVLAIKSISNFMPNGVSSDVLYIPTDFNIPDSVLYLSYLGDSFGINHVSDTLRYFEGGQDYGAIDKLPKDLRVLAGCVYLVQNEVTIPEGLILGSGACIDGEIDTLYINSAYGAGSSKDKTYYSAATVTIGCNDPLYDNSKLNDLVFYKNHHIKNVVYDAHDEMKNYSYMRITADKLKIADGAKLTSEIDFGYYNISSDNLELEIGKNIIKGNEYIGINFGKSTKKLTIYDENADDLNIKGYFTKDTEIFNKSGATIDWYLMDVNDIDYNTEPFITGRLSFKDFYIEVKD